MPQTPLLEAKNIDKSFGAFTANDKINFTIKAGTIHALLGENGAGKSTFVKMLYGVQAPDAGQFLWCGQAKQITSPKAARALGIAMVFQHFSLFPALTVAENIALALDEAPRLAKLSTLIAQESQRWGLAIQPHRPVADLSVGEQQRVEILRCLLQNPKLLIMDEPTSVLTPQESTRLFDVLRRLAKEGCAVLYISHKLDEIMALTEAATILRGGKNVGEVIPKQSSTRKMAEMMVGDKIDWIERRQPQKTPKSKTDKITPEDKPLFQVANLSRPAETAFATGLKNIACTIQKGEIFGIAGISGNGQEELMQALSGEWRTPQAETPQSPTLEFMGQNISTLPPQARRSLGIEFIPEERNGHAAIPEMTLTENTFLTHYSRSFNKKSEDKKSGFKQWLSHPATCQKTALKIIAEHDVRTPHTNPLAKQLSGGNLQKFIMGRGLITRPKLLIVAQPTWGVDVGAATMIRRNLLKRAENGCSIILISQDLEEIFSLSTRIAVLHNGTLSPAADADKLTAEDVGLLMGGGGDTKKANA